jgi:hypothetical protein
MLRTLSPAIEQHRSYGAVSALVIMTALRVARVMLQPSEYIAVVTKHKREAGCNAFILFVTQSDCSQLMTQQQQSALTNLPPLSQGVTSANQ